MVSSIIDQTNQVWKDELIDSYFFEWEAEIIKKYTSQSIYTG